MKTIKVKSRNSPKGKSPYRVIPVEANRIKQAKPAQHAIIVRVKQSGENKTTKLNVPDLVKAVIEGMGGGIAAAVTTHLLL